MPAPEFAGKNECGVRCDVISQLDWSVGRILDTLKRLRLDENTLVLFTSDNGPVVNDGYDDGSDRKLDGHKPAGPFRGGKYTIFEGGTTLPFIVRWTGQVKPGVSEALVSQLDLLASLASLVHQPVPTGTAEDSINVLPALLGKSSVGRDSIVEEAQVLGIREGKWKLIDRSQRPGAHPRPASLDLSGGSLERSLKGQPSYPAAPLELYDITADPGETKNVAEQYPDVVERLRKKLADIRTLGHS
jgi:arylsulfatase A-like enzyme